MDGSALPPPSDDPRPGGNEAADLPDTFEYAMVPDIGAYDTGTYAGAPAPAAAGPQAGAVSFPRIGDYWPDAPGTGPGPGPDKLIAPPPEHPRHRLRVITAVTGAVLVLGVSAVVLTRLVSNDDPAPTPTAAAGPDPDIVVGGTPSPPVSIAPAPTSAAATTPTPSAPPSSPPAATGPAFEAGTFVLASNLTELNVTLGRPPGNGIARVGSPDGSGVVPDATLDGTSLKLTAKQVRDDGSGEVNVQLDERIAWTVRMAGGVKRGTFLMADGAVRDFYFEGGADRLELTLPRQQRQIEIRMAGGVHTWRIGTEGEFPVKVRLRKGAGEVSLNGDRDQGIDRGRTLRSRGSDEKSGGLTIEAVAGIGSLSVSPLD